MKYVRINRGQPEFIQKTNWGGRMIDQKTISKKSNVLITGSHNSGKTRAINHLYENSQEIWSNQLRAYAFTNGHVKQDKPVLKFGESVESWEYPEAVFLCAVSPMSKWLDNSNLEKWHNERNPDTPFLKIPAWKRCELLAVYLKETRAMLFIDNAHKLTGRKLIIAKDCIVSAFRVVIACSDENRLSPSIRKYFLETKPQFIRLNSDVAYDATPILQWLFVVLAMLAGSPEFALAIGAFTIMSGGRRASKQD